jgi:hypothetical protein
MQRQGMVQRLYSVLKRGLLEGYAILTKAVQSGSADPGEWDNLFPAELAGLPNIPT